MNRRQWTNKKEVIDPNADTTILDYDTDRDSVSIRIALSENEQITLTQVHNHIEDRDMIGPINMDGMGLTSRHERSAGPFRIDTPVENTDIPATDYPGAVTTVRASAQLEQRRRMVLESAYYRFQSLSKRERDKVIENMQTTSVDGVRGRAGRFDIGMENGRLVLWDRSDPSQLSPPPHDAMDYLNDQLARGVITAEDMRKVRETVGLESLHAQQRALQ